MIHGKGGMRSMTIWRWLAMAVCTTLGACTVVSSDTFEALSKDGVQATGVTYALPMGLVDVTLFVNQETAEYRVGFREFFVPDPVRRYVLRYHPLPNYKDTVEIKVSSRSLLESVNSTTEDETDNIVVELAKLARSVGGFQAAPVPNNNFVKLANITIDPTEPDAVVKAGAFLSARAQVFAKSKIGIGCTGENAKTMACRRFIRYGQNSNLVELAVDYPAAIGVTTVVPNCSAGLCYRVKEPYIVKYIIDGVRGAQIVYLPNKAPVVEIDITRAFFVQKIQNIEFDGNGFLKTATVNKLSELQAVAALPIAVITAINEALPLRLNIQNQQVDLAQKRLAELDAREAVADARKDPN